jgi:lysyl-tRNA synthetase class 1
LEKIGEEKLEYLTERVKYAKIWLENYAPESFRFEMTENLSKEVGKLDLKQRNYLKEVTKLFDKKFDAESLQVDLYELSKKMNLKPSDAFAAIYLTFIGKTHGPRAGLLLANFGKEKVIERINSLLKT